MVTTDQIDWPDGEAAYRALRSTYPDVDPVLLKFHLHQLDAENATFHDLRNLKADLQRRLDRGITPEERARFQTSRTSQPFGTDLGTGCSPDQALASLKEALSAGYDTFDTAASYMLEHGVCSYEVLTRALDELRVDRTKLTLVFKIKSPHIVSAPTCSASPPISNRRRTSSATPSG